MDKLKNAFAFFLTLFNLSPAASGLTQEYPTWQKVDL